MANGSAAKAPTASNGDGFFARIKKGFLGSRTWRFLVECKVETFEKSAWPTKRELWAFTVVVLFALLVVGTWIGVLDWILGQITALLPSR